MPRPRIFVFALLAGAFGLLAATMAINFALDPQYVFGTPLTRLDDNANYRYHRLRQYQAKREQVDGLLFASSRGRAFDADLVAQRIGAKAVAKFDVTAGMITAKETVQFLRFAQEPPPPGCVTASGVARRRPPARVAGLAGGGGLRVRHLAR